MDFRWEAPLSQPLTCPHCESALELPTMSLARRVLCPNCHAVIPHPRAFEAADPNRIAFATAADHEAWKRYLGPVTILSMIGAAVVWIGTMTTLQIVAGDMLSKTVGNVCLIVVTPAVFMLNWYGIRVAERGRRGQTRFIGWVIVAAFALIGGATLASILIWAGLRFLGLA